MRVSVLNKNPVTITPAAIADHYAVLDRIGVIDDDRTNGFIRPAYSDAESAAFDYVESAAVAAGLVSRRDAVGNLIIETAGEFTHWVETGSHVDTVDAGGNYDGVAGVVAGLAVLIAVQSGGEALSHGLRLRVWRGEESSAFGTASLGAWAAFGELKPAVLDYTHGGRTLAQAMISQHADPSYVRAGAATIPDAERDAIAAHIELHIEQGSVLENKQCDIGIVTGIRGSIRSWVHLTGAFDHSGATPMGVAYRKDANLAMAHLMVQLDGLLARFNKLHPETPQAVIQTFGVVNSHAEHNQHCPLVQANAVSKVSGFAYFSHEIRSCSEGLARDYHEQAQALIRQQAALFHVGAEVEQISISFGIPALNAHIQSMTAACCEEQHRRFTYLPSGAWHDVAVICHQQKTDGSAIPTGMIFIPCRAGISHSAAEHTSYEQIAAGASILAQLMLTYRSGPQLFHG